MSRIALVASCFLLCFVVMAQDASSCPQLQQEAFNALNIYCGEQVEDSLCYGNPTLSVNYAENAPEGLRFSLPGDAIPLNSILWFSTSTEANTWGISRAHLRVYPANSLQVEQASMVLFGDVIVYNRGTEGSSVITQDIEVTSAQGANIRTGTATDFRVIEPVLDGTILKASGRLEDSSWVRVYTSRGLVGWVSSAGISGDIEELPVVTEDDPTQDLILPLQQFDFQSGFSNPDCADVPTSGILLQTNTNDDLSLPFVINDVRIELMGTAYLRARPDEGFLIAITEGSAIVTALESSQTINAGYVSRVFMETDEDGNLQALEAPSPPLVYDDEEMATLPLELLGRETIVALDIYTIITPRPAGESSPIAGMALNAQCTITTGESGTNLRTGPGTSFPIRAVMAYRESAKPIGRTIGTDGAPWWKLAEGVWVRVDTTVFGGDCTAVSSVEFEG